MSWLLLLKIAGSFDCNISFGKVNELNEVMFQ